MSRVALLVLVAACGDGGQPGPAPGPDARLRGPAPLDCEETVAEPTQCRSLESTCTGVCGASWACCYPDHDDSGNETWGILYNDCEPCDAGVR